MAANGAIVANGVAKSQRAMAVMRLLCDGDYAGEASLA
jgi:hypothetical protein